MKLRAVMVVAACLCSLGVLGRNADVALPGGGPDSAWTVPAATEAHAVAVDFGRQPRGSPPAWRPRELPAHFVENRGQFDPRVHFAVWKGGTRAWLTEAGFVLALRGPAPAAGAAKEIGQPREVIIGTVGMTFEGARPGARWIGDERTATDFNYFVGKDPSGWVTLAPSYGVVRRHSIYPGIDVVLRESAGVLEYDLVLEPGASLDDVVLSIAGAYEISVDESGSLVIRTPAGPVIQPRPATFRLDGDGSRKVIACEYEVIDPTRVRFRAPDWDGVSGLIIDPTLIFSTFVGGGGPEGGGFAVAVDTDGSVVVSGTTWSADFPTTPGAFDTQVGVLNEGTILRLSPSGTSLVFATFLGSSSFVDEPRYLCLDSVGNIVVAGQASSSDFPTTAGAYQTQLLGDVDIFVTKMASDGASLVFSTLLGGPCADSPVGMDLDINDRIYLGVDAQAAGCTTGYPTTSNAFCTTPSATGDVNVSRLSSDGSMLEFSSWLCTGGASSPRDLACDDEGHAYLIGTTNSASLPVTAGAFDTTFNGDQDFFIVKVNCDLGAINWWTYLGGASLEIYGDIVVDSQGDAYVTGDTFSSNFPSVPGSFDVFKSGDVDAFVVKIRSDGSDLVYGTFLGGSGSDEGHDIAVDAAGQAFVTGWTRSVNFPVTPDALDPMFNGDCDSFLCKVSSDGSALLYATYLGGAANVTRANGVAVGADGSAAITGYTLASDYPTTTGAYDTQLDGFSDAFVACFDLSPWYSVGGGLAGTAGEIPVLVGAGSVIAGTPGTLVLENALPAAPCVLVLGLQAISAPFKGGTLIPEPLLLVPLATDSNGEIDLPWFAWPSGIQSDTDMFFQAWVFDAGGPKGYAASQGLKATTP